MLNDCGRRRSISLSKNWMTLMQQQQDAQNEALPSEMPSATPPAWVAPMRSIAKFSIAEFTRYGSAPGTDGTPTALS